AKPNSKVCLDGSTPSPRARRGGKHAIAFLLNARGCCREETLLSPFQKTTKTAGFLREERRNT
ncbi:MAG: hypothetical protein IJY66_08200, partial [Clostridia bacterium]|nr:hypothetical protein [Clostridia bacterium]